jgi:teichuronic acid biosynthesis glycosyltransferase TuaC
MKIHTLHYERQAFAFWNIITVAIQVHARFMKLLTFSSLFPNTVKPSHGIFVETRLRYLLASGKVESKVVAPVPWFPSSNPRFGDYARFLQGAASESATASTSPIPLPGDSEGRHDGMAPWLMAQACKKEIGRIIDEGYDFDAIDAHYFYPDGVAAVMLGKYFNKPVVITARGTDINLIPQYALPRKMMWAASNAAGMITVCNALREEMIGLGISGERIVALRNGVDLQRFQPMDRAAARAGLGIDGFTLMSVGVLDPRKAHELCVTFKNAGLVTLGVIVGVAATMHWPTSRSPTACRFPACASWPMRIA